MIAYIAPEFLNPANAQILTGIQERIRKDGDSIIDCAGRRKPGSRRQFGAY